ncbi:MAG: phosphatase PAP2 family protein [Bacteroidota bacterium]
MKLSPLLFFLLLFSIQGMAQSPYQLNWRNEVSYHALGIGLLGAGSWIGNKTVQPLSESEIFALRRSSVIAFDRGATFNLSGAARTASDHTLNASFIMPMLFLIPRRSRSEFGRIALLYSEVFFINLGGTNLMKRSTRRLRPFVYNELASIESKQTKDARYAFFSGHTSATAANTFFAARVFSDYYPDSKWKPLVWTVAVALPAATGYFRVKAGKHFPTDVIAGGAFGAAVGWLIPQLHKTKSDDRLSFVAGPTGCYLAYKF